MDVFDAFPNGIEEWAIAKTEFSTLTGNMITDEPTKLHIIVDEANSSEPNQSPNAQGINADTLLYAMPDELPTLDTAELIANYIVKPWSGDKIYAIVDAGIGKNQETGIIEHVELRVRQTLAEEAQDGA